MTHSPAFWIVFGLAFLWLIELINFKRDLEQNFGPLDIPQKNLWLKRAFLITLPILTLLIITFCTPK